MGDRLIRALSRGGSVCWRGGAWCVFRSDDLRGAVIGELSRAALVSLAQKGELTEARPGQFIWSGSAYRTHRRAKQPDIRPQGSKPRRSPLESVLDGLPTHQERAMARAAAARFAGDMERAAYGQRITQNWDPSLHVDGVASGSKGAGRMESAVAASRRLGQIAGAIKPSELRWLTQLIVEERSLAAMARSKSVSVGAVRAALAEALGSLVRAYRLSVSSHE